MRTLAQRKRYAKECLLLGRVHTRGFRRALETMTVTEALIVHAKTDARLRRAIEEADLWPVWPDFNQAHANGSWDWQHCQQLSLPLSV
jgi:hypothetical protein